jgi:energy-coupling factor transporter transmembrane protein EcfT
MARCYDRYSRTYYTCRRSAWDNWVRWLVLGIIVVGFFFLFVLCR